MTAQSEIQELTKRYNELNQAYYETVKIDELLYLKDGKLWRTPSNESGERKVNIVDSKERESLYEKSAELLSLKMTLNDSPIKDHFPSKEMSFHDKCLFAIHVLFDTRSIAIRNEEQLQKQLDELKRKYDALTIYVNERRSELELHRFIEDQAMMEEMLQQLADYRKRNEALQAEVDRLNKSALENSITFENMKLKLETSNMHLDKMLEEKEHEFDRTQQFESYEICRDYLDGAIYMEKCFNRKSNRIEDAQQWYDNQPVLQK